MMLTLNPPSPTPTDPAIVRLVRALDALRYQLFHRAHLCKGEFGTAANPPDSAAPARYSPRYRFHSGGPYSETIVASGDTDTNCNLMHVGKTGEPFRERDRSLRLMLLDRPFNDYAPATPLSDRTAFLCDQLQLSV